MSFLLRVELQDVPGSLGAVATALGAAGADIEAIQIVEHRADGVAVDDILLELPPTVLPDSLITACHEVEGVHVAWISRYHASASLSMDLETVESFTVEPKNALARLVDATPVTFRTDWALLLELGATPQVAYSTPAAPELSESMLADFGDQNLAELTSLAAFPSIVVAAVTCATDDDREFAILAGRPGGPKFISSEVARLEYMAALAASVQLTPIRI